MNRPVYLLVDQGEGVKPKWKDVGTAYLCKDGSFNFTIYLLPGLVFNCRLPKSIKEARDAAFGPVNEPVPQRS